MHPSLHKTLADRTADCLNNEYSNIQRDQDHTDARILSPADLLIQDPDTKKDRPGKENLFPNGIRKKILLQRLLIVQDLAHVRKGENTDGNGTCQRTQSPDIGSDQSDDQRGQCPDKTEKDPSH